VKANATIFVNCLLVSGLSLANDASDAEQEVAREIGAVLAWRLGPETVEEKCRSLDADGAETRKAALKGWLDKNAALIESVDARVAEVVPLLYSPPPNVDAVQAIRKQVREILLESIFEQKTPDESAVICKAEADPASQRWNNPGMPHVQQALATLLDWQTVQSRRPK
jgi:hypothetical protein